MTRNLRDRNRGPRRGRQSSLPAPPEPQRSPTATPRAATSQAGRWKATSAAAAAVQLHRHGRAAEWAARSRLPRKGHAPPRSARDRPREATSSTRTSRCEADHDHNVSRSSSTTRTGPGRSSPPGTLDRFLGQANQQYRVDIVKPTAPVDSLAAEDVLLERLRDEPRRLVDPCADADQRRSEPVRRPDGANPLRSGRQPALLPGFRRRRRDRLSAAQQAARLLGRGGDAVVFLWPPNHKLEPIGIRGVTDPEGDAVR